MDEGDEDEEEIEGRRWFTIRFNGLGWSKGLFCLKNDLRV